MANDFGITLDEAIAELQHDVTKAIDFMRSEFEDDWETAEEYFSGGSYLPAEPGRSDAVKTEVRDMIRAAMPNIMRALYQARKPVEYEPSSVKAATFVEQQGLYVNQLFAASGGYKILYDAVQQACKLKIGPVKVWWESDPTPEYFQITGALAQEVEALKEQEDIEVQEVTDSDAMPGTFDVEGYRYYPNGKIHFESLPVYEFFVSRNAASLEDAKVHGHTRATTVGDAISMGLEYPNWGELCGSDPESKNASGQSTARRGYAVNSSEDESEDLTQKEIILTEVYCKFDLDGEGREKRYCFIMGGDAYTYITHYEIEDYCMDLVQVDPVPNTVVGRSLADITIEMQDINTSVLRAVIDNAHIANNPRYAGDPNNVAFDDLMNNAIGAPIKTRGMPQLEVVKLPFTGNEMLPFLEYLERDTEERVGITKAATGLDPNALQSTDKDAVLNTISLSQGQMELMVRNIVESGLMGMFGKALRLAQRHMDRNQVVHTKGQVLPVDIGMFDANLVAKPNVGLGTASPEQKISTLQFVLAKQESIIAQFGFDNPFTSLYQIYNTLEDLVELGGLSDVGRYFSVITPDMESKIAEKRRKDEIEAQKVAAANQPMDPAKALIQTEQLKTDIKRLQIMVEARTEELNLQYQATKDAEANDLERDKMLQERMIQLRELGMDGLNSLIEKRQRENDDSAGRDEVEPSVPEASTQSGL